MIETVINDYVSLKRHEGWGIKLSPNKIKEVANNNFNGSIDNDRFNNFINSIDEVKSFISDTEIDEKVEYNNFKKYGYTCITFLDNNVKNKNQQIKVINFFLKH